MLFNKALHKKSATTTALTLALVTLVTGCSKHESEEQGKFKTEEIAAQQGEAARAAVPVPDAKEPAKFVASAPAKTAPNTASATASTASATTTTNTTKTEEKPATKTEGKTEAKAEAKQDASTAVVKETKVVTTKTEVKSPEADKTVAEKK